VWATGESLKVNILASSAALHASLQAQLTVTMGNNWYPHYALQHHCLMPVTCQSSQIVKCCWSRVLRQMHTPLILASVAVFLCCGNLIWNFDFVQL